MDYVHPFFIVTFVCLIEFSQTLYGVTSVSKPRNIFLSRQKRYLLFPKGSNFVMTMSGVKSVMVQFPRNTNLVMECDVPFALPYETKIFKKHRQNLVRRMQRREILDQMENALTAMGVNGNSCVQQMICEANNYLQSKTNLFVGDLMAAVFHDLMLVNGSKMIGAGEMSDYHYNCEDSSLHVKCPVPIYQLLLRTFSSSFQN